MRAIISFIVMSLIHIPLRAHAETIWNWTHQASGSGSANVFDDGPVETQGGMIGSPKGASFQYSAFDRTSSPGVFSARARAHGESIIHETDTRLNLQVNLSVGYFPSLFGGDNPGGMANGEIMSVIEFEMPADRLDWVYGLSIEQDDPFQGSTRVTLENVTQSTHILDLTSSVATIESTLVADVGDVMRLTSTMTGNGITDPTSTRRYWPSFGMQLTIPESTTCVLLLWLLLFIGPKQRLGLSSSKKR